MLTKMLIKNVRRRVILAVGGFRRVELERLGSVDQWTCAVDKLERNSVVISGGIGQNITFEKSLSERIGCNVYLFDPSPTGLETMKRKGNQSEKLHFHKVGLAASDGLYTFGVPDRHDEGSWKKGEKGAGEQFACRSITSIVAEHSWSRVDLLKLDIEGFEYEVIDDIIRSKLEVDQICVELHTSSMISIDKTPYDIVRTLLRLRRYGYRLVNLKNADFTFLHKRVLIA